MSLKVSKYFQFFVTAVGGFTMPLMPKLKFLYVWLGCGKEVIWVSTVWIKVAKD